MGRGHGLSGRTPPSKPQYYTQKKFLLKTILKGSNNHLNSNCTRFFFAALDIEIDENQKPKLDKI
jgi:hypothetical protein